MPARYSADRLFTRQTLRDDARLVLVAPGPSPTGPREHTSNRRTGSVIALCSVYILSLTVQIQIRPQTYRTELNAKGGVKTPLTFNYGSPDLPLNCHPAAAKASANVTPFGAMSVPA